MSVINNFSFVNVLFYMKVHLFFLGNVIKLTFQALSENKTIFICSYFTICFYFIKLFYYFYYYYFITTVAIEILHARKHHIQKKFVGRIL